MDIGTLISLLSNAGPWGLVVVVAGVALSVLWRRSEKDHDREVERQAAELQREQKRNDDLREDIRQIVEAVNKLSDTASAGFSSLREMLLRDFIEKRR